MREFQHASCARATVKRQEVIQRKLLVTGIGFNRKHFSFDVICKIPIFPIKLMRHYRHSASSE